MSTKVIIILSLVIIIELVVILMASITVRGFTEDYFFDLEKQSLETLVNNTKSFLALKHNQFEAIDFNDFNEQNLAGFEDNTHFEGFGFIEKKINEADSKVTFKVDLIYKGDIYYNNIISNNNTRSNLESNLINIFELNSILPQSLPGREKVFTFSKTDEDGIIYLALVSFENIDNIVNIYDFNNILIITKGGAIISSKESVEGNFAFAGMSDEIGRTINESSVLNTAYVYNTSFYNEKGLLSFIAIESDFYAQELRVVTFTKDIMLQQYLRRNMLSFYTMAAILFAVALLGVIIYANSYRKRYDERFKAIGLSEKNRPYIIDIDEWGNIVKINDVFKKKFKANNIFDYLVDFGIKAKEIIDNALSFTVKISDYEGKEHYISFSVLKGHKLSRAIGNESTEQMQDYFSKVEAYRKDLYTDLYNAKALKRDYDFNTPSGECLYVLITVPSIRQYAISFGETFARKIRRNFADRLKKLFKNLTKIYYIGGSDYVIIIEGNREVNSFTVNIIDTVRVLSQPINVDNNQVSLQIKIGITEYNGHEKHKSLTALGLEAETAIQSIEMSSNSHAFYKDALITYGDTYFDNRETLEKIINSNDIHLYYQPQYDTKDNVVGLEGLCRVKNNALRDISTERFISLVEKNGLIMNLSRILYQQAFEFARHIKGKNIMVSLNVSPIQLLQTGFVSDFLGLYKKYELGANSICLEITENVLMEDFEEVVRKLRILRKKGINIQLDDFGMNYSSLLYLKELPIDGIKIDRTFVIDIITNNYSKVIVENIVKITRDLGLICVIEGVETLEQLEIVKAMGDIHVQGWYYSKAKEKNEITNLIGLAPVEEKTELTDKVDKENKEDIILGNKDFSSGEDKIKEENEENNPESEDK